MAPVVSKSNPDDQPIMTVGVSGPFSRQLLADIARYQVEDMLETIPGVGQITTMGYLDRNIRIWVDADKLVATGVDRHRRHRRRSRSSTSPSRAERSTTAARRSTSACSARRPTSTRCATSSSEATAAPRSACRDVALVEDGFEDITSLRAQRTARPSRRWAS